MFVLWICRFFASILLSGSFWGSSRVKGQGLGLGLDSVGFGAYRV